MKNNDVYMQILKHSLNKLLRKKADDSIITVIKKQYYNK